VLGSHTKTKELIIYIAVRLAKKPNYGATLLNKVLYFVDNIAYMKTGKPISEFKYIKQTFGPTPEPFWFLSIKDSLIDSGAIEVVESESFGRVQKRLVPKREAQVDLFSVDEIVIIDEVIADVGNLNASEISDLSHQFPAWKVAADKEELPLFTFLLSSSTPNQSDIDWAKQELSRVQHNNNKNV
jgi:hypothetical protein